LKRIVEPPLALCHKQRGNAGETPVSKKQIFILLGLVVLIAAGAVAWYFLGVSSDSATAATAETTGSGPGYTLTSHDRHMGNPKAPVVLIEYAAPSCPVCAHFNEATFPQLKQNYIDTGKVYYVFRVFPLRSDDGAAEKIARCLPEDKYFPFIDQLFRNQSKWDVEFGVQDVHGELVRMARVAGMSAEQADKCMNDTSLDSTINKVAQDGEGKYNITGTPTIVVAGVAQPSGDIPYDSLKQTIDAALAKK
jgi:protein-disulfide isomerase